MIFNLLNAFAVTLNEENIIMQTIKATMIEEFCLIKVE